MDANIPTTLNWIAVHQRRSEHSNPPSGQTSQGHRVTHAAAANCISDRNSYSAMTCKLQECPQGSTQVTDTTVPWEKTITVASVPRLFFSASPLPREKEINQFFQWITEKNTVAVNKALKQNNHLASAKDSNGTTPLIHAIQCTSPYKLFDTLIVYCNAEAINTGDNEGNTPLMHASNLLIGFPEKQQTKIRKLKEELASLRELHLRQIQLQRQRQQLPIEQSPELQQTLQQTIPSVQLRIDQLKSQYDYEISVYATFPEKYQHNTSSSDKAVLSEPVICTHATFSIYEYYICRLLEKGADPTIRNHDRETLYNGLADKKPATDGAVLTAFHEPQTAKQIKEICEDVEKHLSHSDKIDGLLTIRFIDQEAKLSPTGKASTESLMRAIESHNYCMIYQLIRTGKLDLNNAENIFKMIPFNYLVANLWKFPNRRPPDLLEVLNQMDRLDLDAALNPRYTRKDIDSILLFMLENGLDPNRQAAPDIEKYTPFQQAIDSSHTELVKKMVDNYGADVKQIAMEDDARYTPVQLAIAQRNTGILEYLSKAGSPWINAESNVQFWLKKQEPGWLNSLQKIYEQHSHEFTENKQPFSRVIEALYTKQT